jgi:hypothetical protein
MITPTLYVTRAATLAYQGVVRGGFESARRSLTVRILTTATPDPEEPGALLFDVVAPEGPVTLRAWIIDNEPLAIVTKVAIASHAP